MRPSRGLYTMLHSSVTSTVEADPHTKISERYAHLYCKVSGVKENTKKHSSNQSMIKQIEVPVEMCLEKIAFGLKYGHVVGHLFPRFGNCKVVNL